MVETAGVIWALGWALSAPAEPSTEATSYDITLNEAFTTPEGLVFELRSGVHGSDFSKFELEVTSGGKSEVIGYGFSSLSVRWHIEGYVGGYVYTVTLHPDLLNGTKLTPEERSRKNRLRRLTLTSVAKPPVDVETLKKGAQAVAGAKIREMGCVGFGTGSSVGAGTLRAYNSSTPKTKNICHVQVGLYTGVVFTKKVPHTPRW